MTLIYIQKPAKHISVVWTSDIIIKFISKIINIYDINF